MPQEADKRQKESTVSDSTREALDGENARTTLASSTTDTLINEGAIRKQRQQAANHKGRHPTRNARNENIEFIPTVLRWLNMHIVVLLSRSSWRETIANIA